MRRIGKYLIDISSSGTSFYLYKLKDGTYYLVCNMSFRDFKDYYTDEKKTISYLFENILKTSFAELKDKQPFLVKHKTALLYTIPDEYGEFLIMMRKFLLSLVDREAYKVYTKHESIPDLSRVSLTDALRLLEKQDFFSYLKEQNYSEAADALKRIMSVEEI